MYMCGRLRTASSPSRTLMLSAEYSALAGCAVSKIHLENGCSKYHARSPGSNVKRPLYLSENRLFFRLDPACENALEQGLFSCTFFNQLRVGGGQHHLSFELAEIRHEKGVPLRIELARDVVEEEQRR